MSDAITPKNLIEYEFEIEKETRIMVEPQNIGDYDWINHIIDVYDKSGRVRIRSKNGQLRFSIKAPLLSRDTARAKVCIRIELKPINPEQEKELRQIRDLIMAEEGFQRVEKWGAPIAHADGSRGWINRDSNGNWWFEVDEGVILALPEDTKVIGYQKSSIQI